MLNNMPVKIADLKFKKSTLNKDHFGAVQVILQNG